MTVFFSFLGLKLKKKEIKKENNNGQVSNCTEINCDRIFGGKGKQIFSFLGLNSKKGNLTFVVGKKNSFFFFFRCRHKLRAP